MDGLILTNDRLLYRPRSGVAVYLANVLAHWPADARLRPQGLRARKTHQNGTCSSDAPGMGAGPANAPSRGAWGGRIALTTLRALVTTNRPHVGFPFALRRMHGWYQDRAMRAGAARDRFAAVFEPNCLAAETGLPTVATMHDLSVIEHPNWHPASRVRQWEQRLNRSLRATDHWIAVSRFTAERMAQLLGIGSTPVSVVPLAPRPLPYPGEDDVAAARAASGLPDRYFLALGNLEPRKNLGVLLDAYARLPPIVQRTHHLVIAGRPSWGDPRFWRRLAEHPISDRVLATGFVSDEQAAVLLAATDAVLVPSHYEGFGLPILEAMACARPTVCSDIPTFREVAADAALHVDPGDPAAWCSALFRLADDPVFAAELGQRGQCRARAYCWPRTSRSHAEVFEQLTT